MKWLFTPIKFVASAVKSLLFYEIGFLLAVLAGAGVGYALGGDDEAAVTNISVATFFVLMIGLGVLWFAFRERGPKRLKALASSRGWEYTGSGAMNPLPARGYPFSAVGSENTRSLVRGARGDKEFAILLLEVKRQAGKRWGKTHYTVVAAHIPADIPITVASPQRGWEAVAAAVGAQDIELESAEFNDRWRVQGKDSRSVHAVLHPRAMERLLKTDAEKLAITWDSNAVYLVFRGVKKKWDDIDALLTLLSDLSDLVPAHLRRERPEPDFG